MESRQKHQGGRQAHVQTHQDLHDADPAAVRQHPGAGEVTRGGGAFPRACQERSIALLRAVRAGGVECAANPRTGEAPRGALPGLRPKTHALAGRFRLPRGVPHGGLDPGLRRLCAARRHHPGSLLT